MIILAVFAIKASLAAPLMQNLMTSSRERSAMNRLTAYVRLARSTYVILRGSSDGASCAGV